MSLGKEEGKKKKNLCKNGRVIRLFSMLKIAFCLQSYVAQKLGHRECPRSTVVGRIRKKNWLCLALLAFAEMLMVRTIRRFQRWVQSGQGRCNVFLKASQVLTVVMTFKYAEEPEGESLQSKCIFEKGLF